MDNDPIKQEKQSFKADLQDFNKATKSKQELQQIEYQKLRKLCQDPKIKPLRDYIINKIVEFRHTPSVNDMRKNTVEAMAMQMFSRAMTYDTLINIFNFMKEEIKKEKTKEDKFKDSYI